MKRLLVGLGLLVGCSTQAVVDEDRLLKASPQTIAVLPFTLEDEEAGARARLEVAALRRAVDRRLASTAYLHLHTEEVDRRLQGGGLFTPDQVAAAPRARLRELLRTDALLRVHVTTHYNLEGYLIYRQAIGARVELVDARTGSVLVRLEHAESDTGGLILTHSQALEAIQNTIDNSSDLGFLRLSEKFADGLVRALPPPPEPLDPDPPGLQTVEVTTSGRTSVLRTGDVLTVVARARPGLVAQLKLGSATVLPMPEEEPGVYRGRYRVLPGDLLERPLTVTVLDRWGLGTSRVLRDQAVRIDARAGAEEVK